METLNNERNMDDIRNIIGTICLIFGLLFSFVCIVKCAIKCDEKEKEKEKNNIIYVKSSNKSYEFKELV